MSPKDRDLEAFDEDLEAFDEDTLDYLDSLGPYGLADALDKLDEELD